MGVHGQFKLKDVALVAVCGFPMALLFCRVCLSDPIIMLKAGSMSSTIWVVMWFGNGAVNDFIDSKISWLENPVRRLIYGIIGYTVFPIVSMYLLNIFFEWLWGFDQDSFGYLITAVVLTFLVATFLSARAFFLAWRQLAVNEEKIKKEAITSQYESLKNQVNPHFLFNSLNALTSLIYENQDEAARFVKQLSRVYRYVLDIRGKEVVSIEEELAFLESYMFMQKTRHAEGLIYQQNLTPNPESFVVPLSLQMLVENAIKHNKISQSSPLKIDVEEKDGFIKVTNNIQLRAKKEVNGVSIGLENIRERYKYLSDSPIEIRQENGFFEVKLPILKMNQ